MGCDAAQCTTERSHGCHCVASPHTGVPQHSVLQRCTDRSLVPNFERTDESQQTTSPRLRCVALHCTVALNSTSPLCRAAQPPSRCTAQPHRGAVRCGVAESDLTIATVAQHADEVRSAVSCVTVEWARQRLSCGTARHEQRCAISCRAVPCRASHSYSSSRRIVSPHSAQSRHTAASRELGASAALNQHAKKLTHVARLCCFGREPFHCRHIGMMAAALLRTQSSLTKAQAVRACAFRLE